jgi:hypothetical protein
VQVQVPAQVLVQVVELVQMGLAQVLVPVRVVGSEQVGRKQQQLRLPR